MSACSTAATSSPSSSPPASASASAAASASASSTAPTCPNPEGGTCLGPLTPGTYTTTTFSPQITYTVPAGWGNYEDDPGNFLLIPPGGSLAGVNPGTSDFIGIYAGAGAEQQVCLPPGSAANPTIAATTVATMAAFWRSLPNLTVTPPKPAAVGGLRGVVMDLKARPGSKTTCFPGTSDQYTPVLGGADPANLDHGFGFPATLHMRIYLLDGMTTFFGPPQHVTVAIEIDDVHGSGHLDELSAVVPQLVFQN